MRWAACHLPPKLQSRACQPSALSKVNTVENRVLHSREQASTRSVTQLSHQLPDLDSALPALQIWRSSLL